MSSCNCISSGRAVTIMQKLMTHMSLGNSVADERHLSFPSRYVGVLFAYFDYLLELFGFKTSQFGGSQL